MTTIGPDASLPRAGLESLDGRVSLDSLQRRDQGQGAAEALDLREPQTAEAGRGQDADSGESVLNASAWDNTPSGQRLLPGDSGFEGQLAGMTLSLAADSAADAVLAAFA